MSHTDHNDIDIDDETDVRPPSKKRPRATALLEHRTQASKFRYPPSWPYQWEKRTASDQGEAVASLSECGLRNPSSYKESRTG